MLFKPFLLNVEKCIVNILRCEHRLVGGSFTKTTKASNKEKVMQGNVKKIWSYLLTYLSQSSVYISPWFSDILVAIERKTGLQCEDWTLSPKACSKTIKSRERKGIMKTVSFILIGFRWVGSQSDKIYLDSCEELLFHTFSC